VATESLSAFFAPRGIAVVGASHDPNKLGYGLARNLVMSNYQGVVHMINPKGGSLFGRPMYASLEEAPDPIDLAILLIPAQAVPQALEDCGRRGIQGVVIGSGGFREVGPEGARLEAECVEIARKYGMRLMGPNCIGLLDTHLPVDATFLPPPGPTPGDVAFISHSGAICAAVIDWARGQGFGLSRLVSLGNQADISETDVLAPTAADPYTRVLCLYLEGIRDGRRFVEEASQVVLRKPVIALKVGRFESGRKAVASHTGALAGIEAAYNAAFERAGVIRADSSEEMFDWGRALAWCPLPRGRKMAVLTNAGGPGVTASDAIETEGLSLAVLQEKTRLGLAALLPEAASLNNPIDMLASASPEQYAGSLRLLLADPEVDGVMIILPPPPMYTAGAVARSVIPVIHASDKPVVVALMGERLIQEAVEHFRAARVPEYRFPERAASALGILARRAEFLERRRHRTEGETSASSASSLKGMHPEQVRRVLDEAAQQGRSGFLSAEEAGQILEAYGINVPGAELAATPDEAVRAAKRVGEPVAMKIVSADIPHKSDFGGVLLGLAGEALVREGFEKITASVRAALPEADVEGVLVQQMIPPGQEVIIGSVQDAQFGALVMFGSGGIEVEGLRDVHFGLAPLEESDASRLLDHTWAGRKLRGFRSVPAADRQAVVEALVRLARLAADFPELTEIEVNPLRVLPPGQGVFAVDVRVRLGEEQGSRTPAAG
jgi:acetate---CoA ligase (ADP-forming)